MSRTPLSGTLIEGKYEILSKIKEGGMGTIYQVRHRLLDQVRVVKVMLPQLGSEEEYRHRFIQEAKMATRLKHPNVGTIHDFAVDPDGTAYIVMEYIDGVNLSELLRTSGPPGIPLTLEIAHQTLLALGYLHRKNVVHRDVALDNLMLTHDEEDRPQIKLIDLGISKALDKTIELTSRGVFLGKLKYSSPEQLGSLGPGETLDGRSDLYSLGVSLYELLTGKAPLHGDTPRTLIGAHLFHEPIPFTASDPEGKVPEELRAIIMKALQKKPADRQSSAEEFDREILALREKIAGEAAEPAHKLLSRVRASRGVPIVPVTPSAQDRLDRQFLAHTTPPATRITDGRVMDPDRVSLEATVVDPRSPPVRQPALTRPTGAPVRRKIGLPLLLLGLAAAAAVLILLFVPSKPGESDRPAPVTPPAGGQAPSAAAVPSPEPEVSPSTVPELSLSVLTPAQVAPTAEPPPAADLSRLRRVAEQSRSRASAARDTAERLGAPQSAADLYASGRRKQRDAEALLAREEFERAITAFQDAADLHRRAAAAATAAATRRPTPVEVAEIQQEPPARPAPTEVRELAPTAVPEPPRAPTAVPTPRPRPVSNDEEKIRETIRRYVQSQNTLDADLYERVYPGISGARRQAVENAWRNLHSQQLDAEVRQIRITDSQAEVRVYEKRVAVPRVGSPQTDSRERLIRLEKRGDGWVITSLN